MADNSEWDVFKEPYEITFNGGYILKGQHVGLRRKDGLVVMEVGISKENSETFLVKGNFGEFKFHADRWDQHNGRPTNRYVVWMCLFGRDWPGDRTTNPALIKSFSKDIESALLHFPAGRIFNNVGVNEVVFNINEVTTSPHLVYAREL